MAYLRNAHDSATVAGNGATIQVSDYQNMIFNVAGTSTSFEIQVYASTDGVTFFPYKFTACDDINIDYVTSVTATGKGYEVEIEPIEWVQVRLISIGNGNITVPVSLTKRDY